MTKNEKIAALESKLNDLEKEVKTLNSKVKKLKTGLTNTTGMAGVALFISVIAAALISM